MRPSDVVAVETTGPLACAARLADVGARADASVARTAALAMNAPRERWLVSMVCSFVCTGMPEMLDGRATLVFARWAAVSRPPRGVLLGLGDRLSSRPY